MTVWAPTAVLGFAREAGFVGHDLTRATAIALATSQGDDAYRLPMDLAREKLAVGLWGIRSDLMTAKELAKAFDPTTNAKVAKRLWLAAGKRWDWSPYYSGGDWRRYLSVATEAAILPPQPQQASSMTREASNGMNQAAVRDTVVNAVGQALGASKAAGSR